MSDELAAGLVSPVKSIASISSKGDVRFRGKLRLKEVAFGVRCLLVDDLEFSVLASRIDVLLDSPGLAGSVSGAKYL